MTTPCRTPMDKHKHVSPEMWDDEAPDLKVKKHNPTVAEMMKSIELSKKANLPDGRGDGMKYGQSPFLDVFKQIHVSSVDSTFANVFWLQLVELNDQLKCLIDEMMDFYSKPQAWAYGKGWP
jgi:hypothetical protein